MNRVCSFGSRVWRLLALAPVFLSVSCSNGGSSLYPASGKVNYQGQPAAGAQVTFHPKDAKNELTAVRPSGVAKDDGTYTLTTGPDQGAPAGDYVVTVTLFQEVNAKKGKAMSTDMNTPTEDKLKGAYADRTKSQITRQIKSGTNQLEPIDLK
jgi:hypothetical protein